MPVRPCLVVRCLASIVVGGRSDLVSGSHGVIIAYSRAFMDRYVKGLPAMPALTQASPDVVILRYSSELGPSSTSTFRWTLDATDGR